MGLINCEVCEGVLSEAAVTCIHCGHPRLTQLAEKIEQGVKTTAVRGVLKTTGYFKRHFERNRLVISCLVTMLAGVAIFLALIFLGSLFGLGK